MRRRADAEKIAAVPGKIDWAYLTVVSLVRLGPLGVKFRSLNSAQRDGDGAWSTFIGEICVEE